MRRHLLFTAVGAILPIGVSAYFFSAPERAAKQQPGARRDDTTAGSNVAQTAPGKIRDGLRSAGSRSDWESIPRGFARNQQLFVQAPGASAPAPVELVRSQIIHKTAGK